MAKKQGWEENFILNPRILMYMQTMSICEHMYKDVTIWPIKASQVVLMAKNPLANARDTGDAGQIPGQEDPLEEEMATHSRILAWRIPWTEEPGGLQSMGSQRVNATVGLSTCANMAYSIIIKQNNYD